MKQKEEVVSKSSAWPVQSVLLVLLAVAGFIFAFLSLKNHVLSTVSPNEYRSFCNINSEFNCDAVSASSYSKIFGVPIASYGIIFYILICLLALAAKDILKKSATDLIFLFSLPATIFSLYLFYISKFVIGSFCILCIGMYLINICILFVSWKAGTDRVLSVRIRESIKNIFSFPKTLFGVDQYKGSRASAWCMAGVLLFVASTVGVLKGESYLKEIALEAKAKDDIALRLEIQNELQKWRKEQKINIPTYQGINGSGDLKTGPEKASVVVVEFADFECPACRVAYPVIEESLKGFEDKVQYIFKNYPLDRKCNSSLERDIHKFACSVAELSRCAGMQGVVIPTLGVLFSSPVVESQASSNEEVVNSLIEELSSKGLKGDMLKACMSSGLQKELLGRDIKDGNMLGIVSTPSVFVNGRKVNRLHPELLKAIYKDAALE